MPTRVLLKTSPLLNNHGRVIRDIEKLYDEMKDLIYIRPSQTTTFFS